MGLLNAESAIVSAEWLKSNLGNPDLLIFDATLQQTVSAPSLEPSDANLQIPGTIYFDINGSFSDKASSLPHMMPKPDDFQAAARQLGINQNSQIVIYDRQGVYSSPRARWMLKSMGHNNVAVLDGGFPNWLSLNFPTVPVSEGGQKNVTKGDFVAKPIPGFFCDKKEVLNCINSSGDLILDARSEGRFLGVEPEPRAGLRGGCIPSSQNIPFGDVLMGTQFKSSDQLKSVLKMKVNDPGKRIIISCGSGMTACIVGLAAELADYKKITIYDGSWTEWAQSPEVTIEVKGKK